MIKIALCDDEPKMLSAVSQYVKKYAEMKSIQEPEIYFFDSVKSIENALDDEKSFDIFILDVYIGNELGTDVAQSIRKRRIESPIVFLTTSVEHAPESYETGTLRYLIKPIDPKKFYEAMDAAFSQVKKIKKRIIKLKTENGVESINAGSIMYSEAHDHYQYVILDNGTKIKVRMTVVELFTILIQFGGFARVGSAYIVNLRHIKTVSTFEVRLCNDVSIRIPRGKHVELKKAFWGFHCEEEEN